MVHRFKIIRVIVAGSRDFLDYDLMRSKLRMLFQERVKVGDRIEIVSGTARGADQLGERYAEEHQCAIRRFPADWRPNGTYDPTAGFKRNERMAEYATHLVAFWNGKSRGTQHMIKLAEKHNLHIRVVRY